MTRRAPVHRIRNRRGTVLIVCMWITILLAGVALVFSRSMRAELAATGNYAASLQAAAIARGAEELVLARIAHGEDVLAVTQAPAEAVQLGEGFFWIIRPDYQSGGWAFGIVDESSKLNANTATADMLAMLPSMTEEMAAAIVDWVDDDENPSPLGAESSYYLELGYRARNAPMETVEELLLVRDITTDVLMGDRSARNAVGQQFAIAPDLNNPFGGAELGLIDYLTVYGTLSNASAGGQRRANINGSIGGFRDALLSQLPGDRVQAILETSLPQRPFANVFDFYYKSGMTIEEFGQVVDLLSTTNQRRQTGLVNVNTAPPQVLLALPGMEAADVETLVAARQTADLSSLAWVAEALSQEKAVAIGQAITTRTSHYSAEILAVSPDGRAFKRTRIVVDARNATPVIIYRRDLTEQGWPLDPDILASIRGGELEQWSNRTR